MTEPAKQLSPKRKPKRPSDFTMRDKIAIMALAVPGLIVGEERDGTTDEILAVFQIDHITPCVFGGTREPQNGRPIRKNAHQDKSAAEKTASAKATRISTSHRDWWQRVLARAGQIDEAPYRKRCKRKLLSRPFPKRVGRGIN